MNIAFDMQEPGTYFICNGPNPVASNRVFVKQGHNSWEEQARDSKGLSDLKDWEMDMLFNVRLVIGWFH